MNDPYQQAAKLLISLNPDIARQLLASLEPYERENIFKWINQIESVSSEEAEQLISNFYHFYNNSSKGPQNNFLKLIENNDPELIRRLLQKESPRAIAMLLPFLSEQTVYKILMPMEQNHFEAVIVEAIDLKPADLVQAKKTLEEKWGEIPFAPSFIKSAFLEKCLQNLNDEAKNAFVKTLMIEEQLAR